MKRFRPSYVALVLAVIACEPALAAAPVSRGIVSAGSFLLIAGALLCVGVLAIIAMAAAFVGYWAPPFPGRRQLEEIGAYQLAYGEARKDACGEVRFGDASELRLNAKSVPPGTGINLVELFQSLQLELADENKRFAAYLTPVHAFPSTPFNYLVGQPSYRVDESGQVRMIRVYRSGVKCPPDAPVVAEIGGDAIQEAAKAYASANFVAAREVEPSFAGKPEDIAPDYMPILCDKMARGEYAPKYVEPEITSPVLLCDEAGNLNPAARGWAREPIIRANMKGHWPRKKRWVFWNWISDDFLLSITVADIDLTNFCAATLIDFKTGETIAASVYKLPGFVEMPEEVEQSIAFKSGPIDYRMINEGGDIEVRFHSTNMDGHEVTAEFVIRKPEGHETLNLVTPWSDTRFQCNSKHNTLPVEGTITVSGREPYVMDPETCHGVQDWGRGMWPLHSYWNWAVATGKQGGDLIGVNMGSKWTTGTGSNENAICYNGKLHKIMEDLVWEYDPADWMKPWRVRSVMTDTLDLTLTPFFHHAGDTNLILIRTGGACAFGNWNGTLNFEGKTVKVENLVGWAEEYKHRW